MYKLYHYYDKNILLGTETQTTGELNIKRTSSAGTISVSIDWQSQTTTSSNGNDPSVQPLTNIIIGTPVLPPDIPPTGFPTKTPL
jgi:hypothetical protein